jgi:hypothetical protein
MFSTPCNGASTQCKPKDSAISCKHGDPFRRLHSAPKVEPLGRLLSPDGWRHRREFHCQPSRMRLFLSIQAKVNRSISQDWLPHLNIQFRMPYVQRMYISFISAVHTCRQLERNCSLQRIIACSNFCNLLIARHEAIDLFYLKLYCAPRGIQYTPQNHESVTYMCTLVHRPRQPYTNYRA